MEKLEIRYQEGDLGMRYPELELEHLDKVLGKYGMMRGRYLKEHKPTVYHAMLMEGKLLSHLEEINEQAHTLIKCFEWKYFRTHPLPTNGDFLATYHIRGQASEYAEEIVLYELIYN